MHSKTTLMALCAAAAVKEVAAGHVHQRMHADKREIVWAATETVIVTDYVTVTVTEGQEPTAAAVTTTSSRRHRPHHSHSKAQTSIPVVTSATSTPVDIPQSSATSAVDTPEPSASSTPVVIPEPSTSSTPVVIPTTVISTTMTTAVKPTTTVIDIPSITTPTETSTVVDEPTIVIPITSSSAAPEPTPIPIPNTGGKRGLAYNDASLVSEFLELGGQISWAYNWGSSTGDLPDGVAYYPMLWSPAPDHSNNWDELANAAIAKGSTALLSFNEPDIAAQANMSPQDAAAGHIQWMNPYAGRARISTPAISSSQNVDQGIDWLTKFFSACNGQCHFDFCAAHWYGPGGVNGANLFLDHLKNVNKACEGKPVWVTEFAAESDNVDEFMSTIIQALESEEFSFVEKYSYFMASIGSLFNSPTELSSFGKVYAGTA